MSEYNEKINKAIAYIDSVYRIVEMQSMGITGMYGLEQQRIKTHDELCEILGIADKSVTKGICLYMDKSIGFDLEELNRDYDYVIEKYAKKLVTELGRLK